MKIAYIGYGDFREAIRRLESGKGETYWGQQYTIDFLRKLVVRGRELCAVSLGVEPYAEEIENGLYSVGIPYGDRSLRDADLIRVVDSYGPTHVIVRPLINGLLSWALDRGVRLLPTTASSYDDVTFRKFRGWVGLKRLVKLLNRDEIQWIGNHNVNASRSLERAGVDPRKIVPYDWPGKIKPADRSPKQLSRETRARRLIFVGAVKKGKGVGDCLDAVARLRSENMAVSLTVIGAGKVAEFEVRARELNIADHVEFAGLVEHDRIITLMSEHDAVLVPSHHDYAEAMPFVIYESYCSRTPPIVSDHPMFRNTVRHRETGLVFPAGDGDALAACVKTLLSDATLYRNLSEASQAAWQAMQCPVMWHELVERWLNDTTDDYRWLAKRCLASGIYDQ